jgi:hypothetical protein
MLNPNVDPFFRHVVRIEQQELLKKIEADGYYRQLQGDQPGLRQQISDQIKTAGQWIKFHKRTEPSEPCFDGS